MRVLKIRTSTDLKSVTLALLTTKLKLFMFINPSSIDPDTLNTLIKDFAYAQISTNGDDNTTVITNEAIAHFKQKLLAKEYVIHFTSNDEVEEDARISIRPVSDFSLSPYQVEF